MEPILEMAKDLAYAIQQDERYIRTQMAQAAADEDDRGVQPQAHCHQ